MSSATKKKHVEREVCDELMLPSGDRYIVQVISGRGNNLHEVEDQHGERFLVSMPTKFRKTVWIKRGDYAMCRCIEEGDKVRGEIIHILYPDNIRYIQQQKLWPPRFSPNKEQEKAPSNDYRIDPHLLPPSESEDEDSDDAELDEGQS